MNAQPTRKGFASLKEFASKPDFSRLPKPRWRPGKVMFGLFFAIILGCGAGLALYLYPEIFEKRPALTQLEIVQPLPKTRQKLTVPELRWCLIMQKSLEILQKKQTPLNENAIQNYESRCAEIIFESGEPERTLKELAPYDHEIRKKASSLEKSAARSLNEENVTEAVKILSILGYLDNTSPDSRELAASVKNFRSDFGITDDDFLNTQTLRQLRTVYADLLDWIMNGTRPAWIPHETTD